MAKRRLNRTLGPDHRQAEEKKEAIDALVKEIIEKREGDLLARLAALEERLDITNDILYATTLKLEESSQKLRRLQLAVCSLNSDTWQEDTPTERLNVMGDAFSTALTEIPLDNETERRLSRIFGRGIEEVSLGIREWVGVHTRGIDTPFFIGGRLAGEVTGPVEYTPPSSPTRSLTEDDENDLDSMDDL